MKDLLGGHIKRLASSLPAQKSAVKEVVAALLGPLPSSFDIRFQGRSVHVMAPPAIRNELFIRKEEVLAELNRKFPSIGFTDIR